MPNHGVFVSQKATAISTPVVAESGVPFVVGTAPAHTAATPAKIKTPVLVTSWDEAVEKLGYSDDWKKYTLCEMMYSHFQLYTAQPIVFCNVLDATKTPEDMAAQDYPVADHAVELPFETINDETLVVKKKEDEMGTTYVKDKDYTVAYDSDAGVCRVELLSSGDAYGESEINIAGKKVKTDGVEKTDIVAGVGVVDACMSSVGIIPDLICAPGWSGDSEVAAVMAAKASSINGLFTAKALIDLDTKTVKSYDQALTEKTTKNFVDTAEILFWPMVKLGDRVFHMSTQAAGLMAQLDTTNEGAPYESPSNKNYQMDGACLEDGTEVNLTFEQANNLGSNGIVTCLNFMSSGWVCWGNYTACYPGNTDVKDYFIPISRMFTWVGNSLIKTFWSKIDKPMTRLLLDNIQDSTNIWLAGLVGAGYLLGARVEILESENPLTNLMAGIIKIHVYITPPSPAQEIDFVLEYDASYVTAALAA